MKTRWVITLCAVSTAMLSLNSTALAQTPEPTPEPPSVAPPPEAGGDIVHSWAIGPAGSDDPSQPSDRTVLAYTAVPGSVIDDAVTLYNLGNVDLVFSIYATDAINSADGEPALLSQSDTPTEVGSWVSVSTDSVTLLAGNQITIPIRIVVPNDARPGDHVGAVLASSRTSEGEEGTVALDRRTATMIQIRVDGPITTEVAIADLTADYQNSLNPLGGTMTVTYTIENRGDTVVSGTSNVTVGGPFGIGEQSLPPREFSTLLPGGRFVVTEELDDVKATGIVNTKVEVVPEVSGDDVALQAVSRTTSMFAPPVLLLLGALLVLFGVLTVRAVRRHRERDMEDAMSSSPVREPQLT